VPAVKLKCEGCGRPFWASRIDTLYCKRNGGKCRYKCRAQDAKIEVPKIPRSGVTGVTFNRIRKRWDVTIPDEKRRKYVGAFKSLKQAVEFQKEVMGGVHKEIFQASENVGRTDPVQVPSFAPQPGMESGEALETGA
jgi:hypothetical protein